MAGQLTAQNGVLKMAISMRWLITALNLFVKMGYTPILLKVNYILLLSAYILIFKFLGTWHGLRPTVPERNRNADSIRSYLFLFIWRRNYFNDIWGRFIQALSEIMFQVDYSHRAPNRQPRYRGVTRRMQLAGTTAQHAIILDDQDIDIEN